MEEAAEAEADESQLAEGVTASLTVGTALDQSGKEMARGRCHGPGVNSSLSDCTKRG